MSYIKEIRKYIGFRYTQEKTGNQNNLIIDKNIYVCYDIFAFRSAAALPQVFPQENSAETFCAIGIYRL